jgi:rSAM/selenodomain-associated transferase 2
VTISVVIPTLNEATTIGAAVRSARAELGGCEVIVVDAHSSDDTARIAREAGALVVLASGSRAEAMNLGASRAAGAVLLFLHADTTLPSGANDAIAEAVGEADGGAFQIRFDQPRPWLERIANFRSQRLGVVYGDQGIFVTQRAFHAVGGYRSIPIMEDRDLYRRLRRRGHVRLVRLPVTTSARRHRHDGTAGTLLRGWLVQTLYQLRVSPRWLARLYPPVR